jgi:hypothetical protein
VHLGGGNRRGQGLLGVGVRTAPRARVTAAGLCWLSHRLAPSVFGVHSIDKGVELAIQIPTVERKSFNGESNQ